MSRLPGSARLQESAANSRKAWPQRVIATVSLWNERIDNRRQLARLDARLLADAGISESQRRQEMQKPFWR